MSQEAEHPETRPRARRWLHGTALGLEVVGFLVQIFLVRQVLDYHGHMGCGEKCAWEAMGLMLLLGMGSFVVVPGALAALYFGRQAYGIWRREDGPMLPVVLHAVPLGLLAVIVWVVSLPAPVKVNSPATRTAVTPSAGDQEVAGYVWASDTGIVAERDCTEGTASFVKGCQRYVRQHGGVAP